MKVYFFPNAEAKKGFFFKLLNTTHPNIKTDIKERWNKCGNVAEVTRNNPLGKGYSTDSTTYSK